MAQKVRSCGIITLGAVIYALAFDWFVAPNQIAMGGDRIYTDVQMAHNAGAMGVLVLSGETTLDVADKADPQPHITADSIEILGRLLREAHA